MTITNCTDACRQTIWTVFEAITYVRDYPIDMPPYQLPRYGLRQHINNAAQIHVRNNILLMYLIHRRRRPAPRQFWVRPWISRRPLYGIYHTLLEELKRESRGDFKQFMRMSIDLYHEIMERINGS